MEEKLMAGAVKSTTKVMNTVKDLPNSPAEASGDNNPPVLPKGKTAMTIMQKVGAVKPKSAPKSLGSDNKPPKHKKEKQKKIKMVRDSFTMPEHDYANIAVLKEKCLMAGVHIKKSELLRAGLTYLTKLSKPALLKTLKQVEKIKTGRPAKHK